MNLSSDYVDSLALSRPDEILDDHSEEKDDAGDECHCSDGDKTSLKVILDIIEAGLANAPLANRSMPGEENREAETGARIFLFKEFEPVTDHLKVLLVTEVLGKWDEWVIDVTIWLDLGDAVFVGFPFAREIEFFHTIPINEIIRFSEPYRLGGTRIFTRAIL